MAKKQFKTESKKLLDMMINSIYTHKEVFLRELISNASDACDKLRFRSLTDDSVQIPLDGYEIRLGIDKDARTITISDNGCGMTYDELEKNLGTIAKSGSFDFKKEQAAAEDGAGTDGAGTDGAGAEDADANVAAGAEGADANVAAGAEGAEEAGAADSEAEAPGNEKQVDIIGQFGVGFYSAFMVADCITVVSRAFGEKDASIWQSKGVDGYTIDKIANADESTATAIGESEAGKADAILKNGTVITLHIKTDTADENYSDFLDEWEIRKLIKKYSDYIRYPITMLEKKSRKVEEATEESADAKTGATGADGKTTAEATAEKTSATDAEPKYEDYLELETLNSMVPLWKKPQSQVSDEEYATFYREKFYDYEAPLKVIRQKSEGTSEFEALLFIPARAPYNYYSRDYEKGLQLYSSGVLIMDKCKDLLPDYFSFVRGLVDSADLSLNISREMLQHDRQLRVIAKAVEKKIAAELKKMQANAREDYEKFFEAFGTQLKYGVYSDYGMHKDVLADLLMFKSSYEAEASEATASVAETEATTEAEESKAETTTASEAAAYIPKLTTLAEYVERMKDDQKAIYYVAGESAEAMKMLPQVESVISRGYEVLYLTEEVDEFALKIMQSYSEKTFANVCADDTDLETEAEKELVNQENESAKEMFDCMKAALPSDVKTVKFTATLGKHPVCLSSEGELSANMEKTLSKMPGADVGFKAELALEINLNHPIAERLKNLYADDKEMLAKYSKILYAQARLISGMDIENAAEVGEMVCELMLK